MKKLLLALVAFFMSIAVNAASTYQIKGSWDNWQSLSDMTESNGTWYFTKTFSDGVNFGIQKNDGTYYASSESNTTVNLDQNNGAKVNGSDWWLDVTGEYTIVFDPNQMNLTAYAGKFKGGSTSTIKCQLHHGAEDQDWDDIDMTETPADSKIFVAENVNIKGHQFGINVTEGSSKKWFASTNSSVYWVTGDDLDKPLDASNSNCNNWYMDLEGSYKFTYNAGTNKLTVSGGTITPTPANSVKLKSGSGSSWNDGENMNKGANNVWTLDIDNVTAGKEFVVIADGTEYKHNAATFDVTLDQEYKLYSNQGNNQDFRLKDAGNYTVTVNAADINNMTVKFTKRGGDEPQPGTITVYLNAKTWATPYAYTWTTTDGKTTQYSGAYPGTAMTKVAGRDGYWAITISAAAKNVVFSNNRQNKTNDYVLIDKHLYEPGKATGYSGEAIDLSQKIIYFNAGADYLDPKKMNGEIPLMRLKKNGEWHDIARMRLVPNELAMFMLEVPADYNDATAVGFATTGTLKEFKDGENSEGLDKANWDKYIYGPGNSKAYQSYITFEEYKSLRDNPKDKIFFIGSNVGTGDWTRSMLKGSEKDDGIYYFTISTSGDINFKMSYIDVTKYNSRKPSDYDTDSSKGQDKRWWATFNLGIIGPEGDATDTSGNNSVVDIELNRAHEVNFWNQFNWRGQGAGSGYYVVVDADYFTATLIPFDPQPTISDVKVTTLTVEPTPTDVEMVSGQQIYGSELSGDARIPYVNHATGTATITAAPKQSLTTNSYDVAYTFEYNGEPMGVFNGTPQAVNLQYMVARSGGEISMRALYTDTKAGQVYANAHSSNGIEVKAGEHLKFRSRTKTAKITNDHTLEAPSFTAGSYKKLFACGNLGSIENTLWNALFHVDYEMQYDHPCGVANATDLPRACYPAFVINSKANNAAGYVVEAGNWMVEADKEAFTKGGYTFHKPVYYATDGETYDHDANNWAKLSNNADKDNHKKGTLHINVPEAVVAGFDNVTVGIKVEGYAAYPFLVKPNGGIIVEGAGMRKRLNGGARGADDFDIITEHVPARSGSISEIVLDSGNLSGITDAEIANGDGEAEYFNLQGVRVQGDIVPGVYIVRRGDKVTKEIVR